MKRTLTILLLFFHIAILAQQDQFCYFFLENNRVYFKCVFQMKDKTAAEIENTVKSIIADRDQLTLVSKDSNRYNIKIEHLKIDHKKHGYSAMETTMYISNSLFGGNAQVDIKDGKYRLIITDIYWSYQSEIKTQYVTVKPTREPLKGTIVRNNKPEFRKSQETNIRMISTDLYTLFDYENITLNQIKEDDNW